MPLPLFNIEIRTTAEGGPLARSAALRHPIHKNIRMGGGRAAGKAAGEGGPKNFPLTSLLSPRGEDLEGVPFQILANKF